ncbi:MAG: molybdenum cofactor biosynthesis protein MoaE [Nitratireductor sp.]
MMVEPIIRIQAEDFELEKEIKTLCADNLNIGAAVSFIGLCRDEDGTLNALELEHYPVMAEKQIRKIAKDAIKRFELDGLCAIHRYGKVSPGENIVLVIAASAHRQSAFDGANYLMDFLKTQAPFWKKEHLANGENSKWVDAKDQDDAALDKWQDK